jgi:hypothetical protein
MIQEVWQGPEKFFSKKLTSGDVIAGPGPHFE